MPMDERGQAPFFKRSSSGVSASSPFFGRESRLIDDVRTCGSTCLGAVHRTPFGMSICWLGIPAYQCGVPYARSLPGIGNPDCPNMVRGRMCAQRMLALVKAEERKREMTPLAMIRAAPSDAELVSMQRMPAQCPVTVSRSTPPGRGFHAALGFRTCFSKTDTRTP